MLSECFWFGRLLQGWCSSAAGVELLHQKAEINTACDVPPFDVAILYGQVLLLPLSFSENVSAKRMQHMP